MFVSPNRTTVREPCWSGVLVRRNRPPSLRFPIRAYTVTFSPSHQQRRRDVTRSFFRLSANSGPPVGNPITAQFPPGWHNPTKNCTRETPEIVGTGAAPRQGEAYVAGL